MEKIIWCYSYLDIGREIGSEEINQLLNQGWKVKMIHSSAAGARTGDSSCYVCGQAYVVLEK